MFLALKISFTTQKHTQQRRVGTSKNELFVCIRNFQHRILIVKTHIYCDDNRDFIKNNIHRLKPRNWLCFAAHIRTELRTITTSPYTNLIRFRCILLLFGQPTLHIYDFWSGLQSKITVLVFSKSFVLKVHSTFVGFSILI